MTAISRTAYPRLPRRFSAALLTRLYTPTQEELALAESATHGQSQAPAFLVLLKTFQHLGYFVPLPQLPPVILNHLRAGLSLPQNQEGLPLPSENSLYRYQQVIRTHLGVSKFDRTAQALVIKAVEQAAQHMNYPADLLNVALEELSRSRYELPAFSTLDRLVQHQRTQVHDQLFTQVSEGLPQPLKQSLADLLKPQEPTGETEDSQPQAQWQQLKKTPKQATLSHLEELLHHYGLLTRLGEIDRYLATIPAAKRQAFAQAANDLRVSDLLATNEPKRYTLMLCFIQRARTRTVDALVQTFLKRLAFMHHHAKEQLAATRQQQQATVERLLATLTEILEAASFTIQPPGQDFNRLGNLVQQITGRQGGVAALLELCRRLSAYNEDNYYSFLPRFYSSHRKALFELLEQLSLVTPYQDQRLLAALKFIQKYRAEKVTVLPKPSELELAFLPAGWRALILIGEAGQPQLDRTYLEIGLFSLLAEELKSGDLVVTGADKYADYRRELLAWAECEKLLPDYCAQAELPNTATGLTAQLKAELTRLAEEVDRAFPTSSGVRLNPQGKLVLAKYPPKHYSAQLAGLEAALAQRLPQRTLLESLTNIYHYTDFTRHFGPASGAEPKLEQPVERYLLTIFCYGANLGPTQLARHLAGKWSAAQLAFIGARHFDAQRLDLAMSDIINGYEQFHLPKLWGEANRAAADGTMFDLARNNLVAESHVRYGGYGGIAYHYVSDTYIALLSHFIACGTWEGIYILDLFSQNKSRMQPNILHADTQGQSTPIFALAHLLGISLMPRIRNWQDLNFYRPNPQAHYTHIEPLFADSVDWELIARHWQDLMQLILSIKAGKILPSAILLKLTNYSHKNKLYQAARELGRVVRTLFLLRYISDPALRQKITATTNKAEAYNGFSKWLFFGGAGVIAENDPEEQEKRIKYLDLLANAVIFQNVVDLSQILRQLRREGLAYSEEDVKALSPYLTAHIQRFGDYSLDLSQVPPALDGSMEIEFKPAPSDPTPPQSPPGEPGQ